MIDKELIEEMAQLLKCAECDGTILDTREAVVSWIDNHRKGQTPRVGIVHRSGLHGRNCHDDWDGGSSSWMPAETLFIGAFSGPIDELEYPQQLGLWARQIVNDGVPADEALKVVTSILASGAWIHEETHG